jgi:hypothetical protein
MRLIDDNRCRDTNLMVYEKGISKTGVRQFCKSYLFTDKVLFTQRAQREIHAESAELLRSLRILLRSLRDSAFVSYTQKTYLFTSSLPLHGGYDEEFFAIPFLWYPSNSR